MAPRQAMSSNRETTKDTTNTTHNPFLSSYMSSDDEHQSPSVLEGAASKPKDDTLYQELLRYHEDDPDTSTCQTDENQSASIATEDDRKLPAKPSREEEMIMEQRDRNLYSQEVVPTGNTANSAPRVAMLSPLDEPLNNNNNNMTQQVQQFHSQVAERRSHSPLPPAVGSDPVYSAAVKNPPTTYYSDQEEKGIRHYPPSFSDSNTIPFDEHPYSDHPAKGAVYKPQVYPDFTVPQSYAPPAAQPSQPLSSPKPPPSHHTPTHEKKSSFYESALEASGHDDSTLVLAQDAPYQQQQDSHLLLQEDERLARELQEQDDIPPQNPQDELLAQELSRRLELEDMQRLQEQQRSRSTSPPPCADLDQLAIMNKIRQDAERQQLEAALRESGGGGATEYIPPPEPDPSMTDYLLSQQLAMEECWQHVPRPPAASGMRRTSSTSEHGLPRDEPYRVSMEYYTAPPPSRPTMSPSLSSAQPHHQSDELLERGSLETQTAIANGRSHVVQCQGCLGRLHAPMSYALVYCPKCHTVSPGQTYVGGRGADARRKRHSGGRGSNGR